MKYKIIKSDLMIKGKLYKEGSEVTEKEYDESLKDFFSQVNTDPSINKASSGDPISPEDNLTDDEALIILAKTDHATESEAHPPHLLDAEPQPKPQQVSKPRGKVRRTKS